MADWYYHQGGQQYGPVPVETVRGMLTGGTLRSSDMVWNASMPTWMAAGQVAELYAGAQGAYQPQPSTQPAPVMPYHGMGGMGDLTLGLMGYNMLRQTKPWARVVAVISFVLAGFVFLALILMLTAGARMGIRGRGDAVAVIIGIYLVIGILLLLAAIFANNYANRLGNVLVSRRSGDLDSAMEAQRTFWQFVGIVMIIYCCVMLLIVILAIANA
jgi:hypothetical protein